MELRELSRSEQAAENVQEMLDFIKSYARDSGGTKPTIQEIVDNLDLSSKSIVAYYLDILESQKKIKRVARGSKSYLRIIGETYTC